MNERSRSPLRLDPATLVVMVASAVVIVTMVVAFGLAQGDLATQSLVNAIALVVLQVVVFLAVAAVTLGTPRMRLYGIESLVLAFALTGLAAAIMLAGTWSGVADAVRSPLIIASVLMLVLFDTGRPSTAVDRWVTLPAAAAAMVVFGAIFLLGPVEVAAWSGVYCFDGCTPVGLSDWSSPWLQDVLEVAYAAVRGLVFAGFAVGLAIRFRRSAGAQRSTLVPIVLVGVLVVATGLAGVAYGFISPDATLPEWFSLASFTRILVPMSIAAALLVAHSAHRGSEAALEALRLAPDLDHAQGVLRKVLSDPRAELRVGADAPPEPGMNSTTLCGASGTPCGWLITQRDLAQSDPVAFAAVTDAAAFAVSAISVGARVEELEDALVRAETESVAVADEARRQAEQAIHDTAQARIVLLRGRLRRLARDGTSSSAEAQDELAMLAAEADAVLDDIRAAGMGLRPVAPGQLVPALRDDVRALPMPVEVDDRGMGPVSARAELALHYGMREAMQNALKHAGPGVSLRIVLARDPVGFAWVEVSDDGRGFEPDTAPERGLAGMRRRLRGAGGDLHVRSAPGAGTTVRMTVPSEAAQSAEGALPSEDLSR